jgi:phosphatidate cytidylyltransferase
MHLKRIITALIVLPLAYLYITKLPPIYFSALVAAMGILGLWEFLSMYKTEWPLQVAGLALGALFLLVSVLDRSIGFDMLALGFIVIALVRLLLKGPESAGRDVSVPIIGFLYIPGLLIFQMLLRDIGYEWIIFLYGVIWSADSLAFYVGSSIGRIKLYPSVSPNKTVEGALGAVLGGVLSAILINYLLSMHLTTVQAGVLGLIMALTGMIGDLIESMFKRDAGVKDSGHLFPGHGGMLDKLDSSLISAPVLFWSLSFFLK